MTSATPRESEASTRCASVEPVASHLRDFCGQKLVVIFCPRATDAAVAELEAYQGHAEAFQRAGAWIVAVPRSSGVEAPAKSDARVKLASDPDGLAFRMLAAGFPEVTDAASGIAFLVDRDGRARHAWQGRNRLKDVLSGVRERP
ncbi:MAG: redoxin domain-containing protein [Sphingomonas sp.]